MNNLELERLLDRQLNAQAIKDYCPNGLQVEGKSEVRRVVTGVTASQALVDRAVAMGADALLVHHGYFWKGENEQIRGMKRRRLKALLGHDINLYAYHLPLDIAPGLGNNAQLAALLGIRQTGPLEPDNALSVSMRGELDAPLSGDQLAERLRQRLGRPVLHVGEAGPALIRRVGYCTGGGQGFIELAAEQGMDAFISGEVSEQTVHVARELGLHFFAAGHHATERYGIKALGEWLAAEHGLEVSFVDIDNPA
ncbi:Nif3-like dinuclear metal center hexameric protein [Zobellella denitrificans]|jgi:dinuclear metal center YbgI/SA1388 family protein|uniref:GTP cyclohydrolase 1 type 2 homolog n=1 Tax=Zobellella denitrificans TaxID=347534 RepID=A0A231N1Y1_9GAMM|nr:Nif3-like dinuclear metal center hexameric protein [Zobellella denitrificans]ATG74387.1 metal-binding protein [Zobellella denitrificans]OXS16349.1 Nif3-like dinuclear metal center hexameric protein [Zobellella denitrificans]